MITHILSNTTDVRSLIYSFLFSLLFLLSLSSFPAQASEKREEDDDDEEDGVGGGKAETNDTLIRLGGAIRLSDDVLECQSRKFNRS